MSFLSNLHGAPPQLLDPTGMPAQRSVVKATDIVLTHPDGAKEIIYSPWPKQVAFHSVTTPNFILEGERGTGKSHCLRWDCHLSALSYPGYKYLILRRTMPELRKSHLLFIKREMNKLGGDYFSTVAEARYPNGSIGLFGMCETEADIERYLSAEFYKIVFDEIVTFDWEMITKIGASCRVPKGSGLTALLRGGTNPLGVSAEQVHKYFIARDVQPDEDPDYVKDDWGSMRLVKADNPSLDAEQYTKRFSGLPEAYRKAWLDGVWGVEGAYFSIEPQHLLQEMPLVQMPDGRWVPALQVPWLHVYRLVDFGWHDPTVCVWVVVLPNGREIAFKEDSWLRTPAQQIVADVKKKSDGMRVVTTIADPTMWDGEKEMGHSLADEFEILGVPMTKGKNDRTAAGFAIQGHLNTLLEDGQPKLQIYEPGCNMLVRALRAMRVDKKHPGRIADHKMDHMPICLGYLCMAGVGPSRAPTDCGIRPWMMPKHGDVPVLGSEGVRRHAT